jgi:hypothetical protein
MHYSICNLAFSLVLLFFLVITVLLLVIVVFLFFLLLFLLNAILPHWTYTRRMGSCYRAVGLQPSA